MRTRPYPGQFFWTRFSLYCIRKGKIWQYEEWVREILLRTREIVRRTKGGIVKGRGTKENIRKTQGGRGKVKKRGR